MHTCTNAYSNMPTVAAAALHQPYAYAYPYEASMDTRICTRLLPRYPGTRYAYEYSNAYLCLDNLTLVPVHRLLK